MVEWKKGKPEKPGLYWVALDKKDNPVRLVMIISGFGKVLHYRTLFPLEFIRNSEFKHISALEDCLSYSEVSKPKWDKDFLEVEK